MTQIVDSARVAHIAQAICDVLSSQAGSTRFLQLNELSVVERARMLDAAAIALRTFNRSAVEVATWRAAQALAEPTFSQPWTALSSEKQAVCLDRAAVAINTYGSHLRGTPTPPVKPATPRPSRARQVVNRVLRLVTAPTAGQPDGARS